jgi:hypothetical protein
LISDENQENYLAELLAAEDAARIWTSPIPRPPTAPASRPSSTNKGTLSRKLFFIFAILSTPVGICCHCYFSICASISGQVDGPQEIVAAGDGMVRTARANRGEEFFT